MPVKAVRHDRHRARRIAVGQRQIGGLCPDDRRERRLNGHGLIGHGEGLCHRDVRRRAALRGIGQCIERIARVRGRGQGDFVFRGDDDARADGAAAHADGHPAVLGRGPRHRGEPAQRRLAIGGPPHRVMLRVVAGEHVVHGLALGELAGQAAGEHAWGRHRHADGRRVGQFAGDGDNAAVQQVDVVGRAAGIDAARQGAALCIAGDDGRAGQVERDAVADVYAAALILCVVAADPAAGQVERAGCVNIHAAAIIIRAVAGDAAAVQGERAVLANIHAAAAAGVAAAGDRAGPDAVRDGQGAPLPHANDIAVLRGARQGAVDLVAVQVDGDGLPRGHGQRRRVEGRGGDVAGARQFAIVELDVPARVQQGLQVRPLGYERRLAAGRLLDEVIAVVAGKFRGRAVAGQAGGEHAGGRHRHADGIGVGQLAGDVDDRAGIQANVAGRRAVRQRVAADFGIAGEPEHAASLRLRFSFPSVAVFHKHAAAALRLVAGDAAAGQLELAALYVLTIVAKHVHAAAIAFAGAILRGVAGDAAAGHFEDSAIINRHAAAVLCGIAGDAAARQGEAAAVADDHAATVATLVPAAGDPACAIGIIRVCAAVLHGQRAEH